MHTVTALRSCRLSTRTYIHHINLPQCVHTYIHSPHSTFTFFHTYIHLPHSSFTVRANTHTFTAVKCRRISTQAYSQGTPLPLSLRAHIHSRTTTCRSVIVKLNPFGETQRYDSQVVESIARLSDRTERIFGRPSALREALGLCTHAYIHRTQTMQSFNTYIHSPH